MRLSKYIFTLLVFSIVCLAPSCKKAGKEITEKLAGETTEKVAKGIAKESSEKTLRNLTRKELRSLDWGDLLKMIRKENWNLSEALSKMDGSFQKKIGKAIKEDFDFYESLISSKTVVDEFAVFAKSSPKAAENMDLFRYFVKCRDLETRFGVKNALGNIALKEEMGVVKLLNKADNKIIGELRDGILTFKGTSEELSSVLKKNLIPNTTYKLKGSNGLTYLYQADNLGRISKVEAKGINADQLMSNVIYAKDNMNLGTEWATKLKSIKQNSKGNDIDASFLIKYADDGTTPLSVKADVKVNDKKLVSQSFENIDNISTRAFSTADNASILNRFSSKVGLSAEKKAALLTEMNGDEELAKLIHSNPEFNIKRWLNTRNHVDKSKVAKTANGRMVPNGSTYAGNVYYFNPHLNSGLKARLQRGGTIDLRGMGNLSYEDLIKLDKLYPDGVPFSKEGFPDFTKVAFKGTDGKTLRINIGTLSGDSKKDISKAETLFQKMGYKWESGYTWHHIENSTELIRVPTSIHQLVDHAGGMSTNAKKQITKQALRQAA